MDQFELTGPSFQETVDKFLPQDKMKQMGNFYAQDTPGIQQVSAKYKGDSQMTDIESKIMNGDLGFKPDQDVNVVDPSGKPGKVYGAEIREALAAGYRLEAPRETGVREYVAENDNLAGSAKVAIGQAANQFFMGVPEVAFEHLADPFEVEKVRALKEDHAFSNALGGVVGFGSSVYLGSPIFKGAEAAGKGVGEFVAKQLATRIGLEKGSENVAARILAKSGEAAARLGTEGVVLEAPKAITEASLGDHRAAAESLLIAGGLGVGLGVMSGPVGETFNGLRKIAQDKFKLEAGEIGSKEAVNLGKAEKVIDPMAESDGSLLDAAIKTGVDDKVVDVIKAEQGKLKQNFAKIRESAEALGVPVTEGMASSSRVVQDADSALSQNTSTLAGARRSKIYENVYNKIDDTVKKIMGVDKPELTSYSVGNQLKESIGGEAEKVVKANSEFFNAIGEQYENIPINKKGLGSVVNNISKIDLRGYSGGIKSQVKEIQNELEQGFNSIAELKEYRTRLGKRLSPMAPSEERQIIGQIQEKLLNQEESAIDAFAKSRMSKVGGRAGEKTLQEMDKLGQLFEQRKAANAAWRDMMENFTETGDAIGLGRIRSAQDFLNEIKDVAPEMIAKKFAPRNDFNKLSMLKDKYPEQFGKIMDLEKYKILEKSLKDDKIQAGAFFREIKKLSPEFRSAMFKEEENALLEAAQTIHEAVPKNINPSGTAKTLGWIGDTHSVIGSIESVGKNLASEIQEMKLRNAVPVDGIFKTAGFMGKVQKQLDKIPSILDSAFSGVGKAGGFVASGPGVLGLTNAIQGPSQTNDDLRRKEKFEKLKKTAVDYVANPQGVMDQIAENLSPLSKTGAPNVTNELMMKISSQLKYVNDNIPKAIRASSNFHKVEFVPPAAEVAKFNRKMEVLENPFSVLDKLKNGTLNKDHIESLASNYPVLFQAIQGRIMNHVMENQLDMNFQQRLKMSLLMGYDVDGSTTPQSLASYQNAFANMPLVDEHGDEMMQSGLNKMNPAEQMATPSQLSMMES